MMALAYPAFLVVMASVVLPLPVLVSSGASAYAHRALPGVCAVALALALGLVVAPRVRGPARSVLALAVSRVPVFGVIVVDTARASVLELLGVLLGAGVPAPASLAGALPAGMQVDVGRARRALDDGGGLVDALVAVAVLAPGSALAARVALAERMGTLDKALPLLAKEARGRARARMLALTAVAGLLCFVGVAVAIGTALVGQQQAYFDTIDKASQE
jgi:type II secretory pathway component PulF